MTLCLQDQSINHLNNTKFRTYTARERAIGETRIATLKNVHKVNVRSPASYYAIRY
jgi:hypothetical protein